MHKLGVIVPYRDREEHLKVFVPHLCEYLTNSGIGFEIIVVEQGDSKPFNRGSLLNLGFLKAEKLGCDYVVFHDVDMLPRNVDYSYSSVPLELVKKVVLDTDRRFSVGTGDHIEPNYFGGVTLFPVKAFEKINGYSNMYRGWGFEDDDLFRRCLERGIYVKEEDVQKTSFFGKALEFNGKTSRIIYKLPFRSSIVRNPVSFLTTFQALEQESSESSIFSVPGYNFTLAIDIYGTLKFECFGNDYRSCSIHTKRKLREGSHQVAVVVTESYVKLYLDGELVGSRKLGMEARFFSKQLNIGVGNLDSSDPGFFRGKIANFVAFEGELTRENVRDIYWDGNVSGFLSSIGSYNPEVVKPVIYLDAKFFTGVPLDLTGQEVGVLDCMDVGDSILLSPGFYDTVAVPAKRAGLFVPLDHTKNNFTETGHWKSRDVEANQKLYREIRRSSSYQQVEGLSNVQDLYEIVEEKRCESYFKLKVREK